MKKLFQSAFLLSLAAVFVLGLTFAVAPEADAGASCPLCTVPGSSSSWSLYSSCTDYSDPHCPVVYKTYRNNHSGQICRGTSIIANI